MRITAITRATLLASAMLIQAGVSIAASGDLWPADTRRNQTSWCYGNEWNMLRFGFYSDKGRPSNCNGKFKFDMPLPATEDAVLEVDLPAEVEFLGVYQRGADKVSSDVPVRRVTQDGRERMILSIALDKKHLNTYMEKYHQEVHLWFKPPAELKDRVSWSLTLNGKTLAQSTLHLITAGVLKDGAKLPARFGFYPYGNTRMLPNDDFARMSDFYRRFGMTGVVEHWTYGLGGEPTFREVLKANRNSGVKNIANIGEFCNQFSQNLASAFKKSAGAMGLVEAMNTACNGIEGEDAKRRWQAAAEWFDMVIYDWEPDGPGAWPGYDDSVTAAAFAREIGLDKVTPEELAGKHRKAYERFRMKQTARPLYSLKKLIDSVKPMPMFIEQGDGLGRSIEYDVYGGDFDFVRPMIYKPRPLTYARDLVNTLRSTTVEHRKFVPDTTVGWPETASHRESPEEMLLDTVITAAAGCGGLAHWPELYRTDAVLFGVHDGLTRIALVEDFYFDGKPAENVTVAGAPYHQEKIDLGSKTIDLQGPNWPAVLFTFAHELNDECLITVLNYHEAEDAFVNVGSPAFAGMYLVDPVNKEYYTCDADGEAMVSVCKQSPVMLIATSRAVRIEGCKAVDAQKVKADFEAARKKYLSSNRRGSAKLGAVGDISIAYELVSFGGDEQVCLAVSNPLQSVKLNPSGGRIFDWIVNGVERFVSQESYSSGGWGMDMLWLPEHARWSGDETETMELVSCENDGRRATVVYEHELKRSIPGLVLRKEYVIPADEAAVHIAVTLRNERPGEARVSYWQHNSLATAVAAFAAPNAAAYDKQQTSVFTAEGLDDDLRRLVVEPSRIVSTTGAEYSEVFTGPNASVTFRLPDDFMAIYRWCDAGKGRRSTEWMSKPVTILPAESHTWRVSMKVVAGTAKAGPVTSSCESSAI
ncbi:MAG: hypothetical protein GXY38_09610 [Planctomycetes bacterium]|nr:hypothetical protein [Planctomycetota bacterium]